jgi:hypothetical protein
MQASFVCGHPRLTSLAGPFAQEACRVFALGSAVWSYGSTQYHASGSRLSSGMKWCSAALRRRRGGRLAFGSQVWRALLLSALPAAVHPGTPSQGCPRVRVPYFFFDRLPRGVDALLDLSTARLCTPTHLHRGVPASSVCHHLRGTARRLLHNFLALGPRTLKPTGCGRLDRYFVLAFLWCQRAIVFARLVGRQRGLAFFRRDVPATDPRHAPF